MRKSFLFPFVFALAIAASPVHAVTILNPTVLDKLVQGPSPANASGPWIFNVFSQQSTGPNMVTLSISAFGLTNGFPTSENISKMNLNYSGDPNDLTINLLNGPIPLSIGKSADGFNYGSLGKYDIQLEWADQIFKNGDQVVLTLTSSNPNGISALDFLGVNNAGLQVLGLINNVPGGQGSLTSYVTTTITVPEPMTYVSLATLLIMVAACARRRYA